MDLWSIAKAIASGVVSIPVDLYYGARRTAEDAGLMGADARLENQAERDRLFNLISRAFSDPSFLKRLVEIVLENFFDRVPEDEQRRMASAAGLAGVSFAARSVTQIALVNLISTRIVNRAIANAVAQRIAKFGVGLILTGVLLQGLLERASNAAGRLRRDNPELYQRLRQENLDMLYFIVEDYLQPYLEAARLANRNPAEFRRLLDAIQSQLR